MNENRSTSGSILAREDVKKLLENRDVLDEINRYKWIESEKAGRDIGFQRAAEEWIHKCSESWMKRRNPGETFQIKKAPSKSTKPKRRSAKSYI
ncbi:MAG: DUF4032 domain-containing protein [Candidatus Omnitrophota bacterium]